MKRLAILVAGLLVSVAAHAGWLSAAGKDDDCTKTRSIAWCVLDFGQISNGLKDTDAPNGAGAATVRSDARNTADGVKTAVGVGLAATDALKIGTPLPGMSSGASAATFLFTALVGADPLSSDKPASLVILPENIAAQYGGEASLRFAGEVLTTAITNLLGATKADLVEGVSTALPATKISKTYYRLTGGACEQKECVFVSWLIRRGGTLSARKAPAWLGGGSAYVSQRGDFPVVKVDGKWPQESFYALLSEKMPDWYYIYLPPSAERSYPVVLNKGKQLLFVKPQAGN